MVVKPAAPHAPERGVYYEYMPDHPEANAHGYVRKTAPIVAEQQAPQETVVPATEPKQVVTAPPSALPRVTEVRVTAIETKAETEEIVVPQEPHQPLFDATTLTIPAVAQVNPEKTVFPVLPAVKVEVPLVKPELMTTPKESASTIIEDLQQLIDANPNDVQMQVALRSLYLAYGQKNKALELFTFFPAELQSEAISIVRATMLTAKALEEPVDDTANRAAEALEDLTEQVQEQADLEVSHLEICQDQSVRGFGQYEPLPKKLLESGEPRTVQLYCELKNFKSKINSGGKYVTQIAASIELIDEEYRAIYQLPKTDIPDVPSHHPRHDFFFRGQIRLPRLPAGKYEIVVRVEDKFAGKIARPYRKPFEVKKAGTNSSP